MITESLKNFVVLLNTAGFPIKIKDRYSSESWIYDVDSIALHQCHERSYSNHDILHEIGHWFAAHSDQLLFPEYALEIGIVDLLAFGEYGGEFRDIDGYLKHENILKARNIVPDKEQILQEFISQKFCIEFGSKLNLSVYLQGSNYSSWEEYFKEKDELWTDTYNLKPEINKRYNIIEKRLRSAGFTTP